MLTPALKKTQGQLVAALFFSFAMWGLSACEKKSQTAGIATGGDEIVSNRPSQGEHFFAVVKLKSEPLFASASLKSGKAVIDPTQLKVINEEQTKFLADLAQVAPDTKVIYKYRLILNGFALTGPTKDLEKIKGLAQVATYESDGGFRRPSVQTQKILAKKMQEDLRTRNSVKFIGAENLHARLIPDQKGQPVHLDGTGMKVGILDTGIDYTHSMLGGPGSADLFKSIDPSKPDSHFPNKKVVGGIDLVGTTYNAASMVFENHIPRPDANPLDEGGHGSHVAGTVAGLGDGVETYNGVAPGADLYSIKVFGAEGSTSDSVVIAGLEYSADPNGDGNPEDQLDVVNLSLGSAFGSAKILYSEAIRNLTLGGVVVVASAGNEGDVDYITGSPAAATEAISVAASVDDTSHNWQLDAVKFVTPSQGELIVEAVEGAITRSIEEAGDVSGALVPVGLAAADFSEEVKAQLKGKVALIDRGQVPFSEKIRRAQEAGAVGVVVANNQPGAAFVMGGDGQFDIPGIMVSQAVGANLKAEIAKGEVVIHFHTSEKILKPELIDTITDFSSKGPRTEDSLIKPEISSPGYNIISAGMGEGTAPVRMSGTSMAGPHVAGAMALLKQAHRDLSVAQLKALLLNRAQTIQDAEKVVYPISRQGAGRLRIDQSVDAKVLMTPATLSLGEVALETRKSMRKSITLKNLTAKDQSLEVRLVNRGSGLKLRPVSALTLKAGEEKSLSLGLVLDATGMNELVREMDGWIVVVQGQDEVARVPVLAVARRVASVSASNLVVESSEHDAPGAAASVTLKNEGKNAGEALLFNLLAQDARKKDPHLDRFVSKACDLQSVGYRIVEKKVNGRMASVLQIAAKMYAPLTQWNACEVTVLIDSDGDQSPEQELANVVLDNVPGLATGAPNKYATASVLFDAPLVRELRRKAESDSASTGKRAEEDYSPAVLDFLPSKPYDHSTVTVIEADISKLARRATGELAVKVLSQDYNGSAVETDDYLTDSSDRWLALSVEESAQGYSGLPEKVSLAAGESKTVEFEKGAGAHRLMVLAPQNLTVFSDVLEDQQQTLLDPKFEEPQP
jgi:subtilisin family serine protease